MDARTVLLSMAVVALTALAGCGPATVTTPPEPTAISTPTSQPTATKQPTDTPDRPVPTDTPTPTETPVPKQKFCSFNDSSGNQIEFYDGQGNKTRNILAYDNLHDALNYVQLQTEWQKATSGLGDFPHTSKMEVFFKPIQKIPGWGGVNGIQIRQPANSEDVFFLLREYTAGDGKSLLFFINNKGNYEIVCVNVDGSDISNQLSRFRFTTPTPQP